MAWTEDIYPHFEPHEFHIIPAPQQPTTILQQLPATMTPPGSAPSIRPAGHVKEDLVELMMIQNAQMHQVIMNNMTMSALHSMGHSSPPSGPETPADLVLIEEDEADPQIYHHYYQADPHLSYPYLSYPVWFPPEVYQDPNKPTCSPHTDRPVPPPSSAGAVRAAVTPAAGNNSGAEAEADKEGDY